MLNRGEVLGGAQLRDEFLKGLVYELGSIIGDDRLRDVEPSKDVSFVEAQDVLDDNFCQCFCFYPFGEVFKGYYQIFVLICPHHGRAEEV